MNVLSVDIGTTSLKAGIISERGEVVSFCTKQFNTEKASFIANQWYNAFCDACRVLNASDKIAAVSISGNGPTLVCQNGRTLLWNQKLYDSDTRSGTNSFSMFLPRIKTLKRLHPEECNASEKILSGPEFLVYKLTDNAVTVLPEERFEKFWWTQEDLNNSEIEKQKLPSFIFPGTEAGKITEKAAADTTLPEGLPVFCTGPDFIASLIGTDTLESGRLCDRAGSSEGINFCTDKEIHAAGLRTMPSVIKGLWNLSVIINESGSLLDQYKKDISLLEEEELSWKQIIDDSFSDKNSEGWRILQTLSDSVKSALETLKKIAEKNNLKIEEKITITGGQAKNERWLQKKADDSKITFLTTNCSDAELLGNAATAFYGLKKYKSLKEAAEKIVHKNNVFQPEIKQTKKMEVFKIPQNLKTIIFDIDSTLYTCPAYAWEQVDVQIRHWAEQQNLTFAQARNKISAFRKKWSKEHEGKKISLGNTFTHFGVTIEDSVEMRRTLLEPKNFLSKDEKLIQTLKVLGAKYKMICVTNNPLLPARKTLDALGVSEFFPEIVGLDTCGKSKPALEPFEKALELTQSKAEECLSIGDRFDMDISLPLKMGMGGMLVSGVKDIYTLPDLI